MPRQPLDFGLGVDTDSGDTQGEVMTKAEANFTELYLRLSEVLTSLGIAEGDTNLGIFAGALLADDQSVKAQLEAIEAEVEGNKVLSAAYAADATGAEPAVADTMEAAMSKLHGLVSRLNQAMNLVPGGIDLSAGAYPTTGGSGVSGAIEAGDVFPVATGGEVNGVDFRSGDQLLALVDGPTADNEWLKMDHSPGLQNAVIDDTTTTLVAGRSYTVATTADHAVDLPSPAGLEPDSKIEIHVGDNTHALAVNHSAAGELKVGPNAVAAYYPDTAGGAFDLVPSGGAWRAAQVVAVSAPRIIRDEGTDQNVGGNSWFYMGCNVTAPDAGKYRIRVESPNFNITGAPATVSYLGYGFNTANIASNEARHEFKITSNSPTAATGHWTADLAAGQTVYAFAYHSSSTPSFRANIEIERIDAPDLIVGGTFAVTDNSRVVVSGLGDGSNNNYDVASFTVPESGDYEWDSKVSGNATQNSRIHLITEIRDAANGGGNLLSTDDHWLRVNSADSQSRTLPDALGEVYLAAGQTYYYHLSVNTGGTAGQDRMELSLRRKQGIAIRAEDAAVTISPGLLKMSGASGSRMELSGVDTGGTVTFSEPFSSPPNVTATPERAGDNVAVTIQTVTTTGFSFWSVRNENDAGVVCNVHWRATGEPASP